VPALATHERWLNCCSSIVTKPVDAKVSPIACPGVILCFGSGSGDGTNHQLKVPDRACERLLLSESVHLGTEAPLPFPQPHQLTHTHARTHARTHTHTLSGVYLIQPHTDCWLSCATGDFQGVPPGLQAIPSPPRPRRLTPSGRDDRLIILCSEKSRAPLAVKSVHLHQGKPAADPNLQRVSPMAHPDPGPTLRDGLD
jgi:hypothetical protein